MVIRLKTPKMLILKTAFKTPVKLVSFAFIASVLTACVGTDSASVFDGVKTTQTAKNTQPVIQPTLTDPLSTTINTPSPTANGFRPVPIAGKLPVPVQASNFLPSNSTAPNQIGNNKSINANAANSLSPNALALRAPNALALRSIDESAQDQTSLQLATISTPIIDPIEAASRSRIPALYQSIKHGKCDGQWAPKPKRTEAKRITPGDQFYIEIRMRNTPLMPVGHTFIVYGKLDGSGEPTSERMAMLAPLGGYAGAGIAAAIPVPGVLTPYGDDCKIRPETAYRVSLNAQRYEKLLLALKKAKKDKPAYMLFAQNCNHFMQRMADAVGIKPPKNKYVPAVKYLYDMIEANEGIKIDTRNRSNIVGIGDRVSPKSKS